MWLVYLILSNLFICVSIKSSNPKYILHVQFVSHGASMCCVVGLFILYSDNASDQTTRLWFVSVCILLTTLITLKTLFIFKVLSTHADINTNNINSFYVIMLISSIWVVVLWTSQRILCCFLFIANIKSGKMTECLFWNRLHFRIALLSLLRTRQSACY